MDKKKAARVNVEKIIEGKVVNIADDRPIEGVKVSFQGENYKGITNGEGKFAILAKDNQELVFRHSRFKTTVVLAKDANIVKMEEADSSQQAEE